MASMRPDNYQDGVEAPSLHTFERIQVKAMVPAVTGAPLTPRVMRCRIDSDMAGMSVDLVQVVEGRPCG